MIISNPGRTEKRKKVLLNDIKRFAKAYRQMNVLHINRRKITLASEIVKTFPELTTP